MVHGRGEIGVSSGLISAQKTVSQRREFLTRPVQPGGIDLGRYNLSPFAALGQHLAPRIHDHAVPAVTFAGVFTGAVTGNQEGQISCARARFEEPPGHRCGRAMRMGMRKISAPRSPGARNSPGSADHNRCEPGPAPRRVGPDDVFPGSQKVLFRQTGYPNKCIFR